MVEEAQLGTLNVHILSYDLSKNLIGASGNGSSELTSNLPGLLKQNIKNHNEQLKSGEN